MKRLRTFAAIAALALSLGLGACATTDDTTATSGTSAASDTRGMPSSADERSSSTAKKP